MRKPEISNYRLISLLIVSLALFVASCTKTPTIKNEAELIKYLSDKSIEVIRQIPIKSNGNSYYDEGLYPSEGFRNGYTDNPVDTSNMSIRIYFKNNECGIEYLSFLGYPSPFKIYKIENNESNKINSDPYYFLVKTVINGSDSLVVAFDMNGQCLFAESKIFDISVNDAFTRYYNNAFPNTVATPFDNYSKEQKWLNYRKVTRVNIKYDNTPSSFDWNVKDPRMIPETIEYDGYPSAEYRIDGNIIALDEYIETDPSGFYLRMQFKGEKIVLNHLQSESDSLTNVFSNETYKVTFVTEKYGACAGEGQQVIFGKATIKFSDKVNVFDFESTTSHCQDPKCKEIGNGM